MAAALALTLGACATDQKKQTAQALVWPSPDDARFYWEQTLTGSGDLMEETQQQRLRRMATGETTAGHALQKPWGVAAFDGKVYVGDTISRRVHVFDMRGKKYSTIADQGVGALAKPLDMTTDGNGLLYVCDNAGRRVVVFDTEGKFVRSIGGNLQRPSGVAVNKDGSRIYVVDTGGVTSEKHQIVMFDAAGKELGTIGTRGSAPGQLNLPLSVTYSVANDHIYVVDGGNFRVSEFAADGAFVKAFGDIGRSSGQFARPKAITSDRDGNVYVTDAAFGNFQIFGPDGKLLLDVGGRGASGQGGEFMLPAGITVDKSDGRVYVVDQFFPKVDVFRPASTAEARVPRPASGDQKEAKK
jgi:DNA-binding beta-propeller fold protein YncE